jgi:hypothetical protein
MGGRGATDGMTTVKINTEIRTNAVPKRTTGRKDDAGGLAEDEGEVGSMIGN